MKQWLKDFVHNCVVHPMMPFLPEKWAHEIHLKNGCWAFADDAGDAEHSQALEKLKQDFENWQSRKLTNKSLKGKNQDFSLARFLQKKEEHEAKRKMLDAEPPEVVEVVQLGEQKDYPPVLVPAPTFSQRLEAALVTLAWQGESGERTRLTLMHPDTNIDPVECRREAARVVFYALDTVAWTVPPQVIEQIEQRLYKHHHPRS